MGAIEKDLRSYLDNMSKNGELCRIRRQVDAATEAAGLVDSGIRKGKAILLENVAGRSMPVLGNTLGSRSWIERSLGCEKQGLASWFGERSSQLVAPAVIKTAPVHDVVEEDVDLTKMPILTLHEGDAGPYITGGICIQKDLETDQQNAGYYSLQLKGRDRLGLRMLASTHGYNIFRKRFERGLRTEMAIAIGVHPTEMLAAASHTPFDEFCLAGALRGEPLELAPCKSIDVHVPAHAEMVLEGEIRHDELEPEGPIGDWLGYYPLVEQRHILQIKRITRRHDAIYQTILSGSAEENLLLSIPRAADVLRAARKAVSGVINVSLDPFIPICVIQLQKRFEGEPMNALLAAFGEVPFIKIGIAVDEDVNLSNVNDVLWAVVTRTDLQKDINVLGNLMGFSRDPFHRYKSKLAIDATAPLQHKEHFRRARVLNGNIDLDSYLESTR